MKTVLALALLVTLPLSVAEANHETTPKAHKGPHAEGQGGKQTRQRLRRHEGPGKSREQNARDEEGAHANPQDREARRAERRARHEGRRHRDENRPETDDTPRTTEK